MLPVAHRVTDAASFREATRRGRRAAVETLVAHLLPPAADVPSDQAHPPRVGFVVSKTVGNAVVRNRVRRRLRHLAAARMDVLPAGSLLVLRALPPSAVASSARLGRDLDRALRRLVRDVPPERP